MYQLRTSLLWPLTFAALVGCGADGGSLELSADAACGRIAFAVCDAAAACDDTAFDVDACRTEQLTACCADGFCDGTATVASAAVDACEADLAGAGCAAGMPASCDDILPVPDGTIDVSWGFYASMGCDDFYGTDTIRVVATNSDGEARTRDLPCNPLGGLVALPAGTYSVRADAVAGGGVVGSDSAQTITVPEDGMAWLVAEFIPSTRFGDYCDELGAVYCDACAPNDGACDDDYYAACCADDGNCGLIATASGGYDACLADVEATQVCNELPASCDGVINIW